MHTETADMGRDILERKVKELEDKLGKVTEQKWAFKNHIDELIKRANGNVTPLDFFAAAALTGLIARVSYSYSEQAARDAYLLADYMMKVKGERGNV